MSSSKSGEEQLSVSGHSLTDNETPLMLLQDEANDKLMCSSVLYTNVVFEVHSSLQTLAEPGVRSIHSPQVGPEIQVAAMNQRKTSIKDLSRTERSIGAKCL